MERFNEKRKPYDDLRKSIHELRTKLSTVGDLALSTVGGSGASKMLLDSFGPIEKLLADTFEANKGYGINESINSKVNEMCDTLDSAIKEARNDPTKYHQLGDIAQHKTQPQLLEISILIEKAIDDLAKSL